MYGENSSEKVWKEVEGLLGAFPSLVTRSGPLPLPPPSFTDCRLALSPAEKSPNPSLLRPCGPGPAGLREPARLQAWLTRMTARSKIPISWT